jgi:thioredoxin-like negative regulator of GroEL
VNVDEDENQELAIMYWVRSIPQVNIFKEWEEVDKFIWALPPEEIEKFIAKHTS